MRIWASLAPQWLHDKPLRKRKGHDICGRWQLESRHYHSNHIPSKVLQVRKSLASFLFSIAEQRHYIHRQQGVASPTAALVYDIEPYLVPMKFSLFTLPRSEHLTRQPVFQHRWTVLPDELADLPCADVKPSALLDWINSIFEVKFTLKDRLEAALLEFIDDSCDVGQIYGYLRPWMYDVHNEDELAELPDTLRERRRADFELRSTAINNNRITNPRIPPRRVWDLYANRVLPYYALAPDSRGEDRLPSNLWAVSHSWVAPCERKSVLTTINGNAWRIPIPRGTTLDQIRHELLILGAEYVFLDVLCLRQEDEHLPEFESIRKREWKLDVPTIGYIYNENLNRPVIVYFNGLGLPFTDDGTVRRSKHHWFNRVWTLQECPRCLIPGGLKSHTNNIRAIRVGFNTRPGPSALEWASPDFSNRFESLLRTFRGLGKCVKEVQSRFCSNPVDRVACLAYLLNCPTLPIYDADVGVEGAWRLLIECMPGSTRTQLLFAGFSARAKVGSWQPTWEQLKSYTRIPSLPLSEDEQLKHLDGSSASFGYRHGLDAYYHRAYVIEGCRISVPSSRGQAIHDAVQIPLADGTGYGAFSISEWDHPIPRGAKYLLISVGKLKYWVVAQIEGIRRINGERALEVSQVSTLTIPDFLQSSAHYDLLLKDQVKGGIRLVVYR